MIYTFYSYKGGVGRSMALVNVAELMYQAGLNVLMIDWDLEAPGLERYFAGYIDINDALQSKGVIDMLMDYKQKMLDFQPKEGHSFFPIYDIKKYMIDIHPRQPNQSGSLSLLPSGRRSGTHFTDYANRVITFDWKEFYENWEGENYFNWLYQAVTTFADVVLIDSRTGVTEMGGVCTYQLADVIVLICAANDQNIQGTLKMINKFSDKRLTQDRNGNALKTIVVPSRIEATSELTILNEFRKTFSETFTDYLPPELKYIPNLFEELEIKYVPLYAFKELIAVIQDRASNKRSPELEEAYDTILKTLATVAPIDSAIRTRVPFFKDNDLLVPVIIEEQLARSFINPHISLYAFFSHQDGRELAYHWGKELAMHLTVKLHFPNDPPPDPESNICMIYQQHDAFVVYASVDRKGPHPHDLSVWEVLSKKLFGSQENWQMLNQRIIGKEWPQRTYAFWGMSILFGAEIVSMPEEALIRECFERLPIFPESDLFKYEILKSKQKWGGIWQIIANEPQIAIQSPHIYAIFATKEHANEAEDILFRVGCFDMLELSLHKSYQQFQKYEQKRNRLDNGLDNLDNQLEVLLQTASVKRDKLIFLTKEYYESIKWSTELLELQNIVNVNIDNYNKITEELNLYGSQDNIFDSHLQLLKISYKQLNTDIIYYNSALKRIDTGLQAMRAEREYSEFKQRENNRDLLLVLVGILVAYSQVWLSFQAILQSADWIPVIIRQNADEVFTLFILILTVALLSQIVRNLRIAKSLSDK